MNSLQNTSVMPITLIDRGWSYKNSFFKTLSQFLSEIDESVNENICTLLKRTIRIDGCLLSSMTRKMTEGWGSMSIQ